MSFLELRDVSYAYPGSTPAVDGVTLSLAMGEVHCLLGRSGCGKTTLLKIAAGLLRPGAGEVRGASRQLDPARAGFVFQSPTLLEWLTVRENVLLPLSLHRRPTPDDARDADRQLAQLGLPGVGDRRPWQLSGGQRSRVALARALLPRPPLLLLDEPFAALDAITREELQADLLRVCRDHGSTVLFVTHDIAEAVFLGDRVSVLSRGRLVATLPVEPRQHARDTPAFASTCARVRSALGMQEVVA